MESVISSSRAWLKQKVPVLHDVESWLVDNVLVGWNPSKIPSLHGMNAVVTGANSGIGWHVTRKLAENGAKVFMVVRDAQKGDAAAKEIKAAVPHAQLEVVVADLHIMENVMKAAQELKQKAAPLHILVNNAGSFYPGPFRLTPDGLEQTLAVNYYSHALLTLQLLDIMAPGSRIINMSSEGEWPLSKVDFDNLRGDRYTDSGQAPYGTSKAYIIMFSRELAQRLGDRRIKVFAVQPGLVATPGHVKMDRAHYLSSWLVSGMGLLFGQTPYHGSWSTLFAATDPSLAGDQFAYIGPNQLGLWHATKREPGTPAAKWPPSCYRLFESTIKILGEIVGENRLPPVPPNPNEARKTTAGGPNTMMSPKSKIATAA